MDYTDILKFLTVFLLSSIKFAWLGVPGSIAAGYSFLQSVCVTTAGGWTGVVFFSYLSEWLIKKTKAITTKITKKKPKKKFTLTNKFVVRVKRTLGLAGIALLTPPLLSHPVGVFFAIRYYKDKRRVISYMMVSTLFWSITLFVFYKYVFETAKAWLAI